MTDEGLAARRAAVSSMTDSEFKEAVRRRAWREPLPTATGTTAPAAPPPLPPAQVHRDVRPKHPRDMTEAEFKQSLKSRPWRMTAIVAVTPK
jgi:hypothetical protein